ncbi:MAG: HTH domain-containing protein [Marinifilaceae bacterium]
MNIFEDFEKLERIKKLASLKATGTPKELAFKIGVSERTLYRMIDYLRDYGNDIFYSRSLRTYILTEH